MWTGYYFMAWINDERLKAVILQYCKCLAPVTISDAANRKQIKAITLLGGDSILELLVRFCSVIWCLVGVQILFSFKYYFVSNVAVISLSTAQSL